MKAAKTAAKKTGKKLKEILMSYKEDLMVSLAMSKRGDMAKKWYEGWKKKTDYQQTLMRCHQLILHPPWARPYLFPESRG